MNYVGSDLGQREQDKGTLGHPWMRQFETGRLEDEPAVEQKVKIQGARAVGNSMAAIAPQATLDGQEAVEKRLRIEVGFDTGGGVQKCGLVCKSNRGGFVKRRAGRDAAQGG